MLRPGSVVEAAWLRWNSPSPSRTSDSERIVEVLPGRQFPSFCSGDLGVVKRVDEEADWKEDEEEQAKREEEIWKQGQLIHDTARKSGGTGPLKTFHFSEGQPL